MGMAQVSAKPAAHEKPAAPAELPASPEIDETMRVGLDAADAESLRSIPIDRTGLIARTAWRRHYRHPQLVHRRPISGARRITATAARTGAIWCADRYRLILAPVEPAVRPFPHRHGVSRRMGRYRSEASGAA